MRLLIAVGAAALLAIPVAVAGAADLKRGLQEGGKVGAFNVTKQGGCDDGVKVGQSLCYR